MYTRFCVCFFSLAVSSNGSTAAHPSAPCMATLYTVSKTGFLFELSKHYEDAV